MITTDDLVAAHSQLNEKFQRLTFLLEEQGTITRDDLATINGEPTEASIAFRADMCSVRSERATAAPEAAHTSAHTQVKPQVRGVNVDSVTRAEEGD